MQNNVCHQKIVRDSNKEKDLVRFSLTDAELLNLTLDDFTFREITAHAEKKIAKEFILENEYLGTLGPNSPLIYGAYYKGRLCGVNFFSLPNSFSKILSDDAPQVERLISRGACSSFTPVGLASKFLTWAIKDIVNKTDFRVFIGYSDPMANELGTIYQACNFYYLGNDFGTEYMYRDPYNGRLVSDRLFRHRSAYKNYAKELGIKWQRNWSNEKHTKVLWENMPDGIEAKLRQMGKDKLAEAERVYCPPKHKYVCVLGRDKKETRDLRKVFNKRNKVYPYPKERGK